MRLFNLNKNKYSSKVMLSTAILNIVKYKVCLRIKKIIQFSNSFSFFLNYISLDHLKKTKILGNLNYRVKNLVIILKKYTQNSIKCILKNKNLCFTLL